jgi:hypothetical protein
MQFLTAQWIHLVLANYEVAPQLLEPYVPAKTKLDLFQGKCYVSLVAFLFNQTRVLGIPVPFHRRFEEVNLRFYVTPDREPGLRAVTFIKEIVPRLAIPCIANTLFHENYAAMPMYHKFESDSNVKADLAQADSIERITKLEYRWGKKLKNCISADIERDLYYPTAGSLGEFITEHYWGYAKGPRKTLEYHVQHPQWLCCEIDDAKIDVDFHELYSSRFGFLSETLPANVLYALGSPVGVSFPSSL